ncbi:MAG: S9 family peptidase, partial [Bryobacteraceae bacterium]
LTATDVDERDPKLSPDGRHVSFRKEHDLYLMEIANRKVTRLTHDGSETLLNAEVDWLYPEELDLGTAHWWSPDSSWIAYLQFDISREPVFPQVDLLSTPARYEPQRYPKAGQPNPDVRLGIVSPGGGTTRWFDLGDTRGALLARVHWSPAGKSIAVQRMNRIQNQLDLSLVDIDSGKSRVLLQETDPHWVNLADDFRFLEDGERFLWSSERDGFRHLYLYSIDGKVIRRLTRGEWQVTEVIEVDEESDRVFYLSTESSPLERQLYSVTLEGKRKERISEASGTHAISMSPAANFYVDTFSSLKMPPRKTLHKTDGSKVAVFQEPDKRLTEELEILPAEIVEVKTSDGVTLYGRMIKPANFDPAKEYPVVVMIYGGPHSQMVRNAWPCVCWEQVLAQRGFLIWQLDNRGTSFRGLKFETPVFRNLGEQELKDQKEGIEYLEAAGFADTSRMGIYGWSYGGYMTLYSLMNAPELFKAGIAGAPVVD